jgi:hypothetical protein
MKIAITAAKIGRRMNVWLNFIEAPLLSDFAR